MTSRKTRILVLGGGFGGLYAALYLDKTFVSDPNVEVTLVSRENYALFTPMLHEVAAGELEMSDIVNPIRKMLRHAVFFEAEVHSIDLLTRRVTISHGVLADRQELAYDHLVLALGSETNFFDLPGLAERAITMKSGADPFLLRNRVIALLESASLEESESVRRAMLTFVVAGGGFAGVETVGALNDFVRDGVRSYPKLNPGWIRVLLVHPGSVVLPELGESLGLYAQKKLRERRVEIQTATRVLGYSGNVVELSSGEAIKTATLIWTAGVTPASALKDLPCKKEKGRLVVDENLELPEFPGVWAVGDCAWILNRKTGQPHPPTAQHAIRQATQVGKNIVAAIHGGPKKPFVFSTLGQLATNQTYKAVQVTKPGKLEVVERATIEPAPRQVRIRVEACGVCHTDALTVEGGFPGLIHPRVPGHEVIGKIEAIGPGVQGWHTGQRVGVGYMAGYCGHCERCRRGDFVHCQNQPISGVHSDGGYAEMMIAQANGLAAIPNDLEPTEAAPLLCAGLTTFNALRNSKARPGELVAIQGVGGLGHLGIQFARRMGFQVAAIARGAEKETLAKKLGAHHYIDSNAQDPVAALQALGGAHLILATAANSKSMSPLLGGLAPRGQLIVAGAGGDEPISVNPVPLLFGMRSIAGTMTGSSIDAEDTLSFSSLQGIRPMIETVPLANAAEAYGRMMRNEARFRLVLVTGTKPHNAHEF